MYNSCTLLTESPERKHAELLSPLRNKPGRALGSYLSNMTQSLPRVCSFVNRMWIRYCRTGGVCSCSPYLSDNPSQGLTKLESAIPRRGPRNTGEKPFMHNTVPVFCLDRVAQLRSAKYSLDARSGSAGAPISMKSQELLPCSHWPLCGITWHKCSLCWQCQMLRVFLGNRAGVSKWVTPFVTSSSHLHLRLPRDFFLLWCLNRRFSPLASTCPAHPLWRNKTFFTTKPLITIYCIILPII
jgi:hypothetical protein